MSVNKRQIAQISVATAALILFIVRLCTPGWDAGKILGIIIPILIILPLSLYDEIYSSLDSGFL